MLSSLPHIFLPVILIHLWFYIHVVDALSHGTIVHDDTKGFIHYNQTYHKVR